MKTTYPTFWAKTEKLLNISKTAFQYVKGDIPNTRYVILFNLHKETGRLSFSQSLYDSLEDCLAECDELDELYKSHQLPTKCTEELINKYTGKVSFKENYDYSNGKSWWGYIVLDFKLCQIIRIGGYGFCVSSSFPCGKRNTKNIFTHVINKKSIANNPACRDYFFRDVDKVPDNYVFDDGEYNGWLQYKWGDGTNAIDYVKPTKQKKQNNEEVEVENDSLLNNEYENYEADLIEDKFADLLDKETRKNLMDKFGW